MLEVRETDRREREKGGREGEREGGREGGKEGGREGGREGERERGKERERAYVADRCNRSYGRLSGVRLCNKPLTRLD